MSVFTAVCVDLAKYKPKPNSCDMNIIMWLFSPLACKEVYHVIIFICTAYILQGQANSSTFVHALEINWAVYHSLQHETGFVCKCDSIEMRILLDM